MGRLVTVLSLNWTSGSGEQPTNVTSLFLRNTYKGLDLSGAGPYIRQKGLPLDRNRSVGKALPEKYRRLECNLCLFYNLAIIIF